MNRGEIIGAIKDCGGSFPHLSDLEECVVAIQALAKSERERCAKSVDGIQTPNQDASALLQFAAHSIRAMEDK